MRPEIQRDITKPELLTKLEESILESFSRLKGRDAAILFSGGVDSSLAAILTSRYAKKSLLITAAAEGSHDDRIAAQSAKELGVGFVRAVLNPDVVWETLPRVIHAIETSHRMDVEIALPFYLASRLAKDYKLPLMVSGQGPDELFAGYARYVRVFQEKGEEELERRLWDDVCMTEEANINRDRRAIEAYKIRACFPYLYPEFVSLAMSIPARYKVSLDGTPLRKVIFRELAISLGLPKPIAMQPKKATQFSSGSSKSIVEAIASHSEEAAGCSKREVREMVQPILKQIAMEVGISR